MSLKMESIVIPKRRDNSPTPGGDILEDVLDTIDSTVTPDDGIIFK
jgi:hypothetical protein